MVGRETAALARYNHNIKQIGRTCDAPIIKLSQAALRLKRVLRLWCKIGRWWIAPRGDSRSA